LTRLNWKIVAPNLTEAREELQRLERLAAHPTRRGEIDLEAGLSHAYHHLNFAWHVRRVSTKRYVRCSTADYNRWGRFPKDVWLMELEPTRRRAPRRARGA